MKKSLLKELVIFLFGSAILAVFCLIIGIFILELELPNVSELKHVQMQVPLQIFSKDGKLIAEFGEVKRTPITLNQVPKQFIQATLATEDQRFYSHAGVDPLGLARAFVILVTTGKKWEGGSTITMQVARSFFLSRRKTYIRKIKEILLALKIDHEFTKKKILELYFNQNFYGNRAYGIAAATQMYYGKKLSQLTLPQIAVLAGLPKAPSKLNPLADPKAAKKRRDHVLRRMRDLKYINQSEFEQAIAAPITAKYHGLIIKVHAPYIAEMVRQLMVHRYGKKVYDEGFQIYTTIDSTTQIAANKTLQQYLQKYDHRHGYRGPEKNIGDYNENDEDDIIIQLKKMHIINGLTPSVVISIDKKTATALLTTGEEITIPWNGLRWARKKLIDDNGKEYLGPKPKAASDILKIGDIIRVIRNPKTNQWSLTQIPEAEAAIVAINPHDGAIQALCGGFNYYKSRFNRAIQAERQPGSAFKPFIYSAAFAKGYTLATIINDAPIAIPKTGDTDELWRPENDTKRFYGPTRLRKALIESRNLVSVRLLNIIGIPYAIDYISRFGFNREQLPSAPSLALGTASVTPLQLTTAYAVFANSGYKVIPYFIDHINDHNYHTVFQANPATATAKKTSKTSSKENENSNDLKIAPRIIAPQNAYLVTSALQDVILHGTGRQAAYLHRKDLAGKTGTTNNQIDAWFCGYNKNLVATVWVGYDKPQSLHEYAFTAAVPMWAAFMKQAIANQPDQPIPMPSNIITARIDNETGLLAPPSDRNSRFEVFRSGTVPKRVTNTTGTTYSNNINGSEEANIAVEGNGQSNTDQKQQTPAIDLLY